MGRLQIFKENGLFKERDICEVNKSFKFRRQTLESFKKVKDKGKTISETFDAVKPEGRSKFSSFHFVCD
jgi:hypothetical protein